MNLRLIESLLMAGLLVLSGFLIVERGGLLAWSGVAAALLLGAKVWLWPSSNDAFLIAASLALWGVAWIAVWQYVKAVWESGEVVEITVDTPAGQHSARVWVLDLDGEPTMYYDAPPGVAQQLLSGVGIAMSRGGTIVRECADARRIADVSEDTLVKLSNQMKAKYKARNDATQIFYSVLGGKRDRVPILLRLRACSRSVSSSRAGSLGVT